MLYRRIIILLVSLSLFSCYKTIEYDFPESETLPVLNAMFSDDDGMKVSLTRTYSMNEQNINYELINADVTLYENNVCVDTLIKDTTYYLSDYALSAGNNYAIIANCEDYNEIRSDDYIPEKPVVLSAQIIDSVFVNFEGDIIFQLALEFEDNPNTDDYYELSLYKHYAYDNYGVLDDRYWMASLATENDPILMNENLLEFTPEGFPFSDALFPDGGKCLLRANFIKSSFTEIPKFQLVYVLRRVTYDYYTYRKQAIKHYANQNSYFFEGLGQAVQMYSNVEGGMGIFAGYSQVIDSVYWEE